MNDLTIYLIFPQWLLHSNNVSTVFFRNVVFIGVISQLDSILGPRLSAAVDGDAVDDRVDGSYYEDRLHDRRQRLRSRRIRVWKSIFQRQTIFERFLSGGQFQGKWLYDTDSIFFLA